MQIQSSLPFRAVLESLAGFDRRRKLPSYASSSFASWYRKNYRDKGYGERVALFADTYINYHEPQIGKAAVQLLQQMGYDVDFLEGCCQRPLISHGYLNKASDRASSTCASIVEYEGEVVVCEPGCASAFTDDLPDLVEDVVAGQIC